MKQTPYEALSTENIGRQLEGIDERINIALIEQEHRLVHIGVNAWSAVFHWARDDPRRLAAFKALVWRVLSPETAIVSTIGLGAMVGVFFAFQANQLAALQNKKIDEQTYLSEATRRAALVPELTSILAVIEEEKRAAGMNTAPAKPLVEDAPRAPMSRTTARKLEEFHFPRNFQLSQGVLGRIVALSRSYRPYRFLAVEGDVLGSYLKKLSEKDATQSNTFSRRIGSISVGLMNVLGLEVGVESNLLPRPFSPERGQLLTTLFLSNVHLEPLARLRIDFSYADLSGAFLNGLRLPLGNFEFASFLNASLMHADLGSAFLGRAILAQADLSFAVLHDTDLSGADLSGTRLSYACLPEAEDFRGANLHNAALENALVPNSSWLDVMKKVTSDRSASTLDKYQVSTENQGPCNRLLGAKFFYLKLKPERSEPQWNPR